MKPTNLDLDAKENNLGFVKERISNFVKGIGSYLVVVIGSILGLSLLILIFSGSETLEVTGLVSYLTISFFFLIFYSAVTTSTVDASIYHKTMHFVKRFMDLVLTALAIPTLMPIFLLLSAAIFIESPGPIMFRSKWVGQFGKPFDMYKFRTMHLVSSERPNSKLASFLRRSALDELPQLMSVLNGEMSLVGPMPRKPEQPLDPGGKILTVKPGITGPWQVSMLEKKDSIRAELEYIENWSLALDIKILFKTVLILLSSR